MKKLVSLILVIMVFAMLTSCNLQDTVKSIFGIPRYTVTLEEWHYAFDHLNYTMIYLYDDEKVIESIDYPHQKKERYPFDEKMIYISYVDFQTGYTLSWATDTYTWTDKSNNKWEEGIYKNKIREEHQVSLSKYRFAGLDYEYDYDDFVFDESTNSYTLTWEAATDTEYTHKYKFENGNLISIEIIMPLDISTNTRNKLFITNIGTTVVDWPEITN